jgi:hypothetical protein
VASVARRASPPVRFAASSPARQLTQDSALSRGQRHQRRRRPRRISAEAPAEVSPPLPPPACLAAATARAADGAARSFCAPARLLSSPLAAHAAAITAAGARSTRCPPALVSSPPPLSSTALISSLFYVPTPSPVEAFELTRASLSGPPLISSAWSNPVRQTAKRANNWRKPPKTINPPSRQTSG